MKKRISMTVFSLLCLSGCNDDDNNQAMIISPEKKPEILIIGHRGASALRPEHTLASYQKAMDDGADLIEPDLVPTQDGVLVARHENEIGGTTNVSELSQFVGRKQTKTIDGKPYTGWFTEDFSFNELNQNIRARERIPAYRPDNTKYNDQFTVPSLEQIIDLVEQNYKKTGKIVGLYIETKHPSYFQKAGLPMENTLISTLAKHPYTRDIAPVYLQSFEVQNLKDMRNQLNANKSIKHVKIIQLLDNKEQKPGDGFAQTYAQMATADGLKQIAQYADGVGPSKTYIFSNNENIQTSFIKDAHAAGLKVHPYTFRSENEFLPVYFRCNSASTAKCEAGSRKEFENFFNAGVDGVFADDPGIGRAALNEWLKTGKNTNNAASVNITGLQNGLTAVYKVEK